jgi:electron transfer flavoprotein alpha/beta subunit
MKAKKKPLVEKKLSDVLGSEKPHHQVVSYALPPEKQPGKIFKGRPAADMVKEVVALLRSEAKAI